MRRVGVQAGQRLVLTRAPVGSGTKGCICLHGWFGSADGWGFLPDVVDRSRFTYWFPEMRGYGARGEDVGEYSMREYAADALATADEIGLDRFSVVGHSMGGKAAASLLAQAPERVRALVGVDPVAPAPVPLDED
ncbi:MAG TPA: alpha/beta fold hydrolase [Nocardioidaceae bacterium]|nr:alpha/beta fold hydrolase [Nocardioidaceae bacterium]